MPSHRGQHQIVTYGVSASRIYYTMTDDSGREFKPNAAPHIAIADPAGTAIVAATDMTVVATASTGEGFLAYDAQTAEFGLGEKLTGGTSLATAYVIGDKSGATAATGILHLGNISGVFANNETITDTGSGSAAADGVTYQCTYYYAVDASSTTSYGIARNYIATITYTDGTSSYTRRMYFDVAFTPANYPLVTSEDIESDHPTWTALRPPSWQDWTPAIDKGHNAILAWLYSLGVDPNHLVRRDEELRPVEMAVIEAACAKAIGLPLDEIKFWQDEAAKAKTARGEFTTDSDEDAEVDDDTPKVISGGFTR
jgi:hypothetical protein